MFYIYVYIIFPIASTIAYMVVSMLDWVLLGSSVIGLFLEYSEIGFSLGSSLEPSVIGPSLGYSVIGSVLFRVFSDRVLLSVLFRVLSPRFWYAVCHQLHPQLEAFCNDFVLSISIATDVLILSLGNLMQLPET